MSRPRFFAALAALFASHPRLTLAKPIPPPIGFTPLPDDFRAVSGTLIPSTAAMNELLDRLRARAT